MKHRQRKPSVSNKTGLWIGLGVGGFLLLTGLVVLIVVFVRRDGNRGGAITDPKPAPGPPSGPGPFPMALKPPPLLVAGPFFTKEHLDRLKGGMTLTEAHKALGPNLATGVEDARKLYLDTLGNHPGLKGSPARSWSHLASRIVQWTRWTSGPSVIVAGFGRTKTGDLRLGMAFLAVNASTHKEFQQGVIDGLGAQDRDDEQQSKLDQAEKDRKWVRGPRARMLLVGVWKFNFSTLEFKADSKIRSHLPVLFSLRDPIGYRFVDDESFEIDYPDVFRREVTRKAMFRYFVNERELLLMERNAPNPLWQGPYQRFMSKPGE